MANNKITFNPDTGVAYGVNLVINQGADFRSSFHITQENSGDFDLSDYTLKGKLKKSVSIGSSSGGVTNFTTGITNASEGKFALTLTDTVTSTLKPGRYHFDLNAQISTGSTVYKMASGSVIVEGGLDIS